MKRQSTLVCILLGIGLLFLGCNGSVKDQDLNTNLNSVDVTEVETTMQCNDENIKICYPELVGGKSEDAEEKIIEKINNAIQRDLKGYYEKAEQNIKASGENKGYYYIAEVMFNQKGQFSIVKYVGLGDTSYQYADTYRLANGEKASLGEVMNMTEKEAVKTVQTMLAGVYQSDLETFYPDAVEIMKERFSELQYYRSGEGMGIFFQAGVVAPKEKGVLEIVIQ